MLGQRLRLEAEVLYRRRRGRTGRDGQHHDLPRHLSSHRQTTVSAPASSGAFSYLLIYSPAALTAAKALTNRSASWVVAHGREPVRNKSSTFPSKVPAHW